MMAMMKMILGSDGSFNGSLQIENSLDIKNNNLQNKSKLESFSL